MHLQINIPANIEAQLNEHVAQTGKTPEKVALEALEEKLAHEAEANPKKKLSSEEFKAKLNALIALHPQVSHFIDDSRESIYEGRGE